MPIEVALAQAPVITTVIPMANAQTSPRTSPLTVNFNQPLTAASAGALKVFSAQRGGLRTQPATPAVVSGSALSFVPTAYPFLPGEKVSYTVTTAAASSSGPITQARVGQFTAATGGGTGIFQLGANYGMGSLTGIIAMGDVDGDGDLDLLVPNTAVSVGVGNTTSRNTVSIWPNNGSGVFNSPRTVLVNAWPNDIVVGDLDGDGDLDFIASDDVSSGSVRLNDGSGAFSGNQNIGVARFMSLGDVDGDGDLDLVSTSAVQLNNGNGTFGSPQNLTLGSQGFGPQSLALGDVDGDGDLDLVTANSNPTSAYFGPGTVSIRLNNGSGSFSGNQEVSVGSVGYNLRNSLALGDVDGDGDLDVAVAAYNGTVSVRVNDGNGLFSGTLQVPTVVGLSVALGDADGDGDLDLFTGGYNAATIRLNNGSGSFSGTQQIALSGGGYYLVTGDVDGDGDLDMLSSDDYSFGSTLSVRLNSNTALASTASHPAAGLALFPNPTPGAAKLTGAAPYASLTVFDALGHTVLTVTAGADGTAHIALPTGLYLVRNGTQVRRLIVE